MRMLTIQRAALLGLLVLGVGVMGCTAKGDSARERMDAAQQELALRAGIEPGKAAPPAAAPAGGGGSANDPAKLGQAVAAQFACAACHSIDGKAGVGPTWKGLSGHEVELADGSKVAADDAYLKESITNPSAKIVKGFASPSAMPATFATQLKPEQIDQLIAYIKSLK